jgi:hypothetical protein
VKGVVGLFAGVMVTWHRRHRRKLEQPQLNDFVDVNLETLTRLRIVSATA